MPPNDARDMGTIRSEPRPRDVMTGSRARTVVAVVIRQARTRRSPAKTVASRIASRVAGRTSANR